MDLLFAIGILLGLTAVFGVINERYLHFQPAIGLMLLALLMTVILVNLKATGVIDAVGWEQVLVEKLDLSSVLLNGDRAK